MNYSDWEQRKLDEGSGLEADRDAMRRTEQRARRQQRARHLSGGEQYDADLARDAVEPFDSDEAA